MASPLPVVTSPVVVRLIEPAVEDSPAEYSSQAAEAALITAGISVPEQEERRQVPPAALMAAWPAGEHWHAWSVGAQEASTMAEERQAVAQEGMVWAAARRGRSATKTRASFILMVVYNIEKQVERV